MVQQASGCLHNQRYGRRPIAQTKISVSSQLIELLRIAVSRFKSRRRCILTTDSLSFSIFFDAAYRIQTTYDHRSITARQRADGADDSHDGCCCGLSRQVARVPSLDSRRIEECVSSMLHSSTRSCNWLVHYLALVHEYLVMGAGDSRNLAWRPGASLSLTP